ncbi:NUDIX hydrolase [Streptomyces triticirhizae]|uniref:NUDIX domain-containing protein n=1 Tax=Streptomyces triticirhizae TaxID=2483353 RepID=A0A3M2LPE0_9ACTN|nr:NUDIX domain-containing protein [Streptomyces triticirhizae]RMI39267.1 NUDIX domain-containing protein [Streptomyces triticirhizae]
MGTNSGGSPAPGRWFPPDWPDRIRALARGELTPAPARPAATVLLLRDGDAGPEVFLLRRRRSMAFAGGAHAYPGGAVDPRDGTAEDPGRSTAEEPAPLVVLAALRELFEEAGVLLAGPTPDSLVADVSGEDWEADRRALAAHELSFSALLARRALLPRGDLLRPWARWITPEFESRRYDTWFFAAALPPGQRGRNASTEADHVAWLSPAEALAGYERGEWAMMPPTVATLRQLLPHRTTAEALAGAAGHDLTPVIARATLVDDEVVLSWPGHREFEQRAPHTSGQVQDTRGT